ncbi:MAG: hypothetical protein IJL57_04760 [Bacteroidales bacterium]|nr:hypothetical protein [Bacteroidales bacterium]
MALLRCTCWRVLVIFQRRFRSLTAFAAEWCIPPYETKGEKMGGREKLPLPDVSRLPPIFSPISQYVAHHSASDDRNWRNLLRSKTNFHKKV